MNLKKFLSEQGNSHAKEELFNYRLFYDLKLAAAETGYHLLSYSSDVDHDGFDIVIDDRVILRKYQLKTVVRCTEKKPKTGELKFTYASSNWKIHKHLLRPSRDHWEYFGFDLPSIPSDEKDRLCGVEGGVILMAWEVDSDGELNVEYWYTDLYLITAIELKILPRDDRSVNAANRIRSELPKGAPNQTMSVSKGMFVRADTPERLLELANMKTQDHANWQARVLTLSAEKWGPKDRNGFSHPDAVSEANREALSSIIKACGHSSP